MERLGEGGKDLILNLSISCVIQGKASQADTVFSMK